MNLYSALSAIPLMRCMYYFENNRVLRRHLKLFKLDRCDIFTQFTDRSGHWRLFFFSFFLVFGKVC